MYRLLTDPMRLSNPRSSRYRNVSTAHGSHKICRAQFGSQWSEFSPSDGNTVVGLGKERCATESAIRVCDRGTPSGVVSEQRLGGHLPF